MWNAHLRWEIQYYVLRMSDRVFLASGHEFGQFYGSEWELTNRLNFQNGYHGAFSCSEILPYGSRTGDQRLLYCLRENVANFLTLFWDWVKTHWTFALLHWIMYYPLVLWYLSIWVKKWLLGELLANNHELLPCSRIECQHPMRTV